MIRMGIMVFEIFFRLDDDIIISITEIMVSKIINMDRLSI